MVVFKLFGLLSEFYRFVNVWNALIVRHSRLFRFSMILLSVHAEFTGSALNDDAIFKLIFLCEPFNHLGVSQLKSSRFAVFRN